MQTEIELERLQHVDIAAEAGVLVGDSIDIQNINAEDVWVYEASEPATVAQGRLLRRGDVMTTSRGSPGVYAVCTKGKGIITAEPVSEYKTFTVDNEPIALKEGRQFRAVRKIVVDAGTPKIWKFTALADFQLIEQQLSTSVGDIELHAYRADQVNELTSFNTPVPVFLKNITNRRRKYDGIFYERKNTITTGGSLTLLEADEYVDYDRGKTSNATAQQVSVNGSENSLRNLLGDDTTPADYYLVLTSKTGTSEGRFSLAWTEFI